MKSDCTVQNEPQGSPLRVLFFEDCREDIDLCLLVLRSAGFHVQWDMAVTLPDFIDRIRTVAYDVILSDYRMPQSTGMEVFESMQAEGIHTPFILVTGSLGDEMATACLKEGVTDYVLKDRLARLPNAIHRARAEESATLERSRADVALRASEASYRSLIQNAPCGILRLGAADGRLLDANSALARMLGYDSPWDLLRGTSGRLIGLGTEALSRLVSDGAANHPVECEILGKRKDGAQLTIKLAGRLVHSDCGAPDCLEMIAENVTRWRQANRRIEQLNRLYSVLTHANQTIVRTREKGILFQEICRIIVEEGGFRMAWLGLVEPGTGMVTPLANYPQEVEYLDGIRVSTGPEPEGRGPVGVAIRENRRVVCNNLMDDPSMEPWRQRAIRRSYWSLAAFPVVNRGQSIGALVIYAAEIDFFDIENVALLAELAADVSFALESIESEQMHQRVAADLDQFFALSLDLLCIADLDGYMHRVNPAWEKTLGYTAAEMCSKPWVEFVHPEDRKLVLQAHERLRSGSEVRNLELRFQSKSGSCKWLVACAAPELDRGVVIAAASDITEQKTLEERLRSQNLILEERNRRIEAASRMKNEFLANMSHELRSPLNGIVGFSELLYDGKLGELAARPREYVGRIHASASHLLQLINGVLDLSKIEAGHLECCPERVRISGVIHEVTGILGAIADGKKIRVETEMEEGVDEVTIDEGRLRQVLYNYLSNALKFTGEGGRVVVRVKSEGDFAFRLEVSDSGIGVAEKDLPRLFVEFQQLDATRSKRYQGTGLGLALTRRIVEAQGGRVGVASSPGQGSTFFAALPRMARSVPATQGSARILVVDDQSVDLCMLSQALASNGYLVETAATGDEAYEKCRREMFDAITLDLVPEDQPGWEVLARIRSLEKCRQTPVIVITGCEGADLKVPMPVAGILTKPVGPDDLLQALKEIGVPTQTMRVANG